MGKNYTLTNIMDWSFLLKNKMYNRKELKKYLKNTYLTKNNAKNSNVSPQALKKYPQLRNDFV